MVSHTDIWTVFQHYGWHAQVQVLGIKHALFGFSYCIGMMQNGTAPFLSIDMLRADSQQLADGILDSTDVATGIDHLRLHAQIGSLHLIDGCAVSLTVLPKCLLGL